MGAYWVLWLLMSWCWSTGSSVSTLLTKYLLHSTTFLQKDKKNWPSYLMVFLPIGLYLTRRSHFIRHNPSGTCLWAIWHNLWDIGHTPMMYNPLAGECKVQITTLEMWGVWEGTLVIWDMWCALWSMTHLTWGLIFELSPGFGYINDHIKTMSTFLVLTSSGVW